MRRIATLLLLFAFIAALPAASPPIQLDQYVQKKDSPAPPAPAPGPIFPDLPIPPSPAPVPPEPNAPTKLPGDQLYVIRSDTPLLVLTSPPGMVQMTYDDGPIKIRAKFVDSPNGKIETRYFKEKCIYSLEAIGTGTCELLVIPVAATDVKQVVRRFIDANIGPLPPPVPPVPPIPPVPPVPEPPVPSPDGLRVLVVYDDFAKPPVVVDSALVRQFYWAKCVKGPDGKTPEFRSWHKSVTPLGSPWYKAAFAKYPGSGSWMIAVNGGKSYMGALPATVDDLIKELQRVGN